MADLAPLPDPRPGWRTHARCTNTPNPDTFYPDQPTNQPARICATCPVQLDCGTWGIRHERWGVWGGMGPSELAAERRRRGIPLDEPRIDDHDDRVWRILSLTAEGLDAHAIAERLGVTTRTVHRALAARRAA